MDPYSNFLDMLYDFNHLFSDTDTFLIAYSFKELLSLGLEKIYNSA